MRKFNANKTDTVILANGSIPGVKTIRAIFAAAGFIVCADGGANQARKLGITPDVIIGDFDSISAVSRRFFRHVPQIHIPDQENTDLEKAILYCIGRKVRSVTVVGASGDRIDHVTGALGCFKKFGKKVRLKFVDALGELIPVGSSVTIATAPGTVISLIPIGKCSGISTTNLRYPLKNESLEIGVRDGISNEVIGTPVSVTVARGTLLLYRFR
jgi:thiamine pyrophosphokinase